jgi:hypothetical protein
VKVNATHIAPAVLAAALVFAAPAAAQDPDAEADPDAPIDETAPSVEAPVSDAPPYAPAPAPPPAAPAEGDTGFASAGLVTISDDLQVFVKRVGVEGRSGHMTDLQLRPAVDVFVLPNLSIGGQLILGYTWLDTGEEDSRSEIGVLARAGYNIAFSGRVSLWPRVGIGFRHVSGAVNQGASASGINAVPFQLYVPIVVQIAPHFFVGGGALVATDLYYEAKGVYGPKETAIGLQSTIGGYFRGF